MGAFSRFQVFAVSGVCLCSLLLTLCFLVIFSNVFIVITLVWVGGKVNIKSQLAIFVQKPAANHPKSLALAIWTYPFLLVGCYKIGIIFLTVNTLLIPK